MKIKSHLIKSIFTFIISVIIVKLLSITSFPETVFPKMEAFYSKTIYGLSSYFSFSLGDVFYIILIFFGLIVFGKIMWRVFKKDYASVKKQTSFIFYFLTVFYVFFHFIWGFNYYKNPLNLSFNTEIKNIEELKQITEFYYLNAKTLRGKIQEDENGVFKSNLSRGEWKEIMDSTSEKLRNKYPELRIKNSTAANLKDMTSSEFFSYLGVAGYYNPFTIEGQLNTVLPDSKKIFSGMHETAHQFGFANEGEANFIGFLIGKESGNIDMEYASNFAAMRNLLNRIVYSDSAYVRNFVENKYSDGMKRDREYEFEIWKKYSGRGDETFAAMNEAFLKLNNQEGLKSYGTFVELLVGFHRKYSQ